MGLFPMIQPELSQEAAQAREGALPLYKEVAWDFANGRPIFDRGNPVFVTGAEAVKVWGFKALMTPRTLHEIYSWDFGSDVWSLVGQSFAADTKKAEAERYVREALGTNPYITNVSGVQVSFTDSRLSITVAVSTVYGEVLLDVNA